MRPRRCADGAHERTRNYSATLPTMEYAYLIYQMLHLTILYFCPLTGKVNVSLFFVLLASHVTVWLPLALESASAAALGKRESSVGHKGLALTIRRSSHEAKSKSKLIA